MTLFTGMKKQRRKGSEINDTEEDPQLATLVEFKKCNLNKMREREREHRTRSDVTKLRKKSLINNKTISILQHV